MNNRNLELLIRKSESAMIRMVFWFAASVIGAVMLVFVWADPTPRPFGFGIAVLQFAIGLFVSVLYLFKYARLNELMHNIQPPAPPRFETLETVAPARALELQPTVNLLLLTKYKFTPSEWRQLVRELRYIKPRWTRRALERSGLFLNITAPGEFGRVCQEFQRIGAIQGKMYRWEITPAGWEALCKAAGMTVII